MTTTYATKHDNRPPDTRAASAPFDRTPGRASDTRSPSATAAMIDELVGGTPRAVDAAIQRRAAGAPVINHVHAAAAHGISGGGSGLPHQEQIQRAFGRHDVGQIQAHVGGAAAEGAAAMGAEAFATGHHVAFARSPDLHTAAHEAAHVIQQRAGVQLKGGVGEVGDTYERHADAVADAVVAGRSAESLLDTMSGGHGASGPVGGAVQHKLTIGGDAKKEFAEKLNGIAPAAFVVASTDADPIQGVKTPHQIILEARVTGDNLPPQVVRFAEILQKIVAAPEQVYVQVGAPDNTVVIASFEAGRIDLNDIFMFGVSSEHLGENVASSGLAVLAHELYEQWEKKKAQDQAKKDVTAKLQQEVEDLDNDPTLPGFQKEFAKKKVWKRLEHAVADAMKNVPYAPAHETAIREAEDAVSGWTRDPNGDTADDNVGLWSTSVYTRDGATQKVTHRYQLFSPKESDTTTSPSSPTPPRRREMRVVSVSRETMFTVPSWTYTRPDALPDSVLRYADESRAAPGTEEVIRINDTEYRLQIGRPAQLLRKT